MSSIGRSRSHSNPAWVVMSLMVSVSVAVSQTLSVFLDVSLASKFHCVRKCFAISEIFSKSNSIF